MKNIQKAIDFYIISNYYMWRDIIRIGQPFSGMAIILLSSLIITIAVLIWRLTL